ncbi:type II secretion system F family protein [Streptomyces sp. NPDC048717]|uniref:type II secretion system F family protein n=1 Tax=Streptomyces sp. NPDC048717 TaxID=3154928 RepID=UPI003446B799
MPVMAGATATTGTATGAMTGAAVLCAAVACAVALWWWTDGHGKGRRRARAVLALPAGAGGPSGGADAPSLITAVGRWWGMVRGRREWLCLPGSAVVALLGASPLPLLAGVAAVPLVGRGLRTARERAEREARAGRVVALCGAVAGELKAGWQPAQALAFAARTTGALGGQEAAVLAAARFGGDVPKALRRAARRDGAGGLAGMAACWQVAVDGGAGLAAGLNRLETALRAHRDQRERVRAQLAGAWATVGVLAVLPVAGLGLGAALGARPLRVLLHTPAGLGCLLVGGALEALGLWWASRIVRGGERL